VLPDWHGRLWFATTKALVGTVNRPTGAVHTRRLGGERIGNSFAVDETGGVFIVSDHGGSGRRFVAITDNADPRMHVLVYRRGLHVGGHRLVCKQAVFGKRHGAMENSLI
jgi:hypothetical protein